MTNRRMKTNPCNMKMESDSANPGLPWGLIKRDGLMQGIKGPDHDGIQLLAAVDLRKGYHQSCSLTHTLP